MGWFDSGFGDWVSGDFNWGDTGLLDSSGGGDYSSLGNWAFGGDGGGGLDWGSLSGVTDGNTSFGGSSGSNWGSMLGSIFGGSGQNGGSGDIFGALLSGLASGAGAALDAKSLKEIQQLRGQQAIEQLKQQGLESRKSLDYEYQLKDYYGQQDKARKRVALDTYGQFSQMDRIKKNYKPTGGVQVPAKPIVS